MNYFRFPPFKLDKMPSSHFRTRSHSPSFSLSLTLSLSPCLSPTLFHAIHNTRQQYSFSRNLIATVKIRVIIRSTCLTETPLLSLLLLLSAPLAGQVWWSGTKSPAQGRTGALVMAHIHTYIHTYRSTHLTPRWCASVDERIRSYGDQGLEFVFRLELSRGWGWRAI